MSICGIAKLGIRTRGFVRGTCERVRTLHRDTAGTAGHPRLGQPCGRCAVHLHAACAEAVRIQWPAPAGRRLPQCHSLANPPTKHLAS